MHCGKPIIHKYFARAPLLAMQALLPVPPVCSIHRLCRSKNDCSARTLLTVVLMG